MANLLSSQSKFLVLALRWWRLASFGNVVGRINKVDEHRARLVLGWVTVCMWESHPGQLSLAVGRRNEYRRKLGRKQAHRAMHWPRIRGLAV